MRPNASAGMPNDGSVTSIPTGAPFTLVPSVEELCHKSGCPSDQFIEPITLGCTLFLLTFSKQLSRCLRAFATSARGGMQTVHRDSEGIEVTEGQAF